MNQNEADQRNAAFNELRSFWENGVDPVRALGYLRTKYPDSVLQYATDDLIYHRPQNAPYTVGDIFPELKSYPFNMSERDKGISDNARKFLDEFFSTYGGDFNAYNKLAAKYPALVSSEVFDYLKGMPEYVKRYPEIFGEDPSLESQYATQAVQNDYLPSAEELVLSEDTENQEAQSALSIPPSTENIIVQESVPDIPEKSNVQQSNVKPIQKKTNEQPRSNKPTAAKSAKPVAVEQPQEVTAAKAMVNAISPEPIRAKNTGYAQPPLNHATDAIWDRVRKAGLSSPEQAIRSGIFSPDEVRYITENDLWRYRQ